MYRLISEDALILQGDAVAALRQLEADRGPFAHATITSPPYFQKFDYQSGPGEIGWEDTLDGYLDALHQVLAALYAVTIPGGALFLNIGETYNNYSPQRKHSREIKSGTKFHRRRKLASGLREKQALNVPLELSETAIAAGWMPRSTFAWIKTAMVNGEPTASVTGRPTKSDRPGDAWEMIFYLRKPDRPNGRPYHAYWDGSHLPRNWLAVPAVGHPLHPCPFPAALVRPLILATVPPGGWVIDPFGGTGTVLLEALKTDRRAVSIDLSHAFTDYLLAEAEAWRSRPVQGLLFG
ncbi:MAG TPA: site-specific DNA-methyltransferase [Coleofasciculaceae cyanobacterium]